MEKNTLGKRIKEARLAKKMTQSEVVGDFITRNMLSQIESGSATPSVKTLEYLCKVLEIEPNTLLPDENDSKNAPDAEVYISIRKEFINKNYKAVIEYVRLRRKLALWWLGSIQALTVPRIFKRQ